METITQNKALQNVHTGLSPVTTATSSQTVMLFDASGLPIGKAPLSTDAVIDLQTGKTLRQTLDYIKPVTDTSLYVDMGLPSGTLWAKKNVDATQANGFCASEYQYECSFFSWGNVEPHNPTSSSAFSYNWGTSNDGPYASTPGASISYPSSAGASYDAAHVICNTPWRLPSTTDFKELFDNCDFIDADGNVIASSTTDKRCTMNSIVGLRIRSKINGGVLFFAASGLGNGTSWSNRGSGGHYWSSSLHSEALGRRLNFNSGGVSPQNGNGRYYGFAVRPVQ